MTLRDEIERLLGHSSTPEDGSSRVLLPATDTHGENALSWTASSVVWTVGGVEKRKWTYSTTNRGEEHIIAASFAKFSLPIRPWAFSPSEASFAKRQPTLLSPDTFGPFALLRHSEQLKRNTGADLRPKLCICIFRRDIAFIHSLDGLEFTINMPFAVARVWRLAPVGLMFFAAGFNPIGSQTGASSLHPASSPPLVYSLLSPYDEIRPVHESIISTDDSDTFESPLSPHDEIMSISAPRYTIGAPDPSLVLVFNAKKHILRVLSYELQHPKHSTSLHPEVYSPPDFQIVPTKTILREVWRTDVPPNINHTNLYLCVFDAILTESPGACAAIPLLGTLHILSIQHPHHLARHSSIDIATPPPTSYAAAEVLATRCIEGFTDLLVIRPDGSLVLLSHGGITEVFVSIPHTNSNLHGVMAQLAVRSPFIPLPSYDRSPRVVSLKDPEGAFVTVVFEGGQEQRTCTDLSPRNPLVRSALHVLAQICPTQVFQELRARFLSERHVTQAGEDGEFECFSKAVIDFLSGTTHIGHTTPAASGPWSRMKSHRIYQQKRSDRALRTIKISSRPSSSSPLPSSPTLSHPFLTPITHALHLLGEELKLDSRKQEQLLMLVPLIVKLGYGVGPDWVEYWLRTCPDVCGINWDLVSSAGIFSPMSPPDIIGYLHTTLGVVTSSQIYMGPAQAAEAYHIRPAFEYGGPAPSTSGSTIPPPTLFSGQYMQKKFIRTLSGLPLTHTLLAVYASMKAAPELSAATSRARAHLAVETIIAHGLTHRDIDCMPVNIATPIIECIRTAQNLPKMGGGWGWRTYMFIGREDLAKMTRDGGSIDSRDGLSEQWDEDDEERYGEEDKTSLFGEFLTGKCANQNDMYETIDVIGEHSRALASMRIPAPVEMDPSKRNFSNVRFAEDQRLREMDMLLDSSRVPNVKVNDRPDINEHDLAKELGATVNHIVERTFSQPFGRAIYTFGSISRLSRDEYYVPPLELQVKFVPQNMTYAPDMTKIQPEAKSWAEFHNGLAAAVKVSPYAAGIDSSWIAYNKPQDLSAEHAGYLLGLGLTGHLRNIWSWHGYRYLVPKHELTSIAILLGLGASHIGSGDQDSTRLLTIHMRPLLPVDSAELGIPLGAQVAALMGIGLLYLGTGNHTMAEVAMRELSIGHLSGGPEIPNEHREAYTITAGLAYGLIMCGLGTSSGRSSDEKNIAILRAYVAGKEPSDGVQFSASTPILGVNLNYVTPAATIALALMFLKTNREDIASTFELPPDPAGLKEVQPSLLLLRALGRSLIMWDEISPSISWVLGQAQRTPKDLSRKQVLEGTKELYEFAFYNILSGACLAIGLKFAGSGSDAAQRTLLHFHDKLFENLRRQSTAPSFDNQLRRAVMREAINFVDLALSLVMAGTGDIASLQRFRLRHGLFGPHIKFGAHIATHMALGFLFLGGGRYTLGISNAAIACLVVSLFPRFPLHSNDTRGFLPAFRHLWVLAVEPRCVVARDADTNEITRIPIRIKTSDKAKNNQQYICPTLLPDFNRFLSLKIDSPRYWQFTIDAKADPQALNNLIKTQTIYVKRRAGFLGYSEDPTGYQSISVWNGTPLGDPSLLDFPSVTTAEGRLMHSTLELPRSWSDMGHITRSSVNEQWLLAFADRLCRSPPKSIQEASALGYIQQSLLEVISGDKPLALPIILTMYQLCTWTPTESSWAAMNARDLHLTNEFYSQLFRFHGGILDNNSQRQSMLRMPSVQIAINNLTLRSEVLRREPSFARVYRAYIGGSDVGESLGIYFSVNEWVIMLRSLAFVLQHERVPVSQTLGALKRMALQQIQPQGSANGTLTIPPATWRTVRVGLALIIQKTAASLMGPRFIPWSLESVVDAVELWFRTPASFSS
ncbi:hypothetical protein DL93DRAFT_2172426 [Clavulina sp. PMI_390]|nr:hypothetical protein DL93DRAFT_2172426 [Clavulina sp. PMI_390]